MTITARRVQRTWHSSIECEVRRMERESFTASIMASHNERRALGSIPLDGSSYKTKMLKLIKMNLRIHLAGFTKNTTAGFPMNAMAVDNFRLLPPE